MDLLVSSSSRDFSTFFIHHGLPRATVVCSSESDNLSLEVRLFTQELVDFVIQITDFIVGQTS
jgi:hypothetical protein